MATINDVDVAMLEEQTYPLKVDDDYDEETRGWYQQIQIVTTGSIKKISLMLKIINKKHTSILQQFILDGLEVCGLVEQKNGEYKKVETNGFLNGSEMSVTAASYLSSIITPCYKSGNYSKVLDFNPEAGITVLYISSLERAILNIAKFLELILIIDIEYVKTKQQYKCQLTELGSEVFTKLRNLPTRSSYGSLVFEQSPVGQLVDEKGNSVSWHKRLINKLRYYLTTSLDNSVIIILTFVIMVALLIAFMVYAKPNIPAPLKSWVLIKFSELHDDTDKLPIPLQ